MNKFCDATKKSVDILAEQASKDKQNMSQRDERMKVMQKEIEEQKIKMKNLDSQMKDVDMVVSHQYKQMDEQLKKSDRTLEKFMDTYLADDDGRGITEREQEGEMDYSEEVFENSESNLKEKISRLVEEKLNQMKVPRSRENSQTEQGLLN